MALAGEGPGDVLPEAVTIRLISPAWDLSDGMHFRDVPTATTIRELKLKIQGQLPPSVPIDRVRLIYLGRSLSRDDDTLLNVLGRTAVGNAPSARRRRG